MVQRYLRFAGYLLPVFIVCTSVALLGARAKPSGADPYTPTKQEWLVTEFNASCRIGMGAPGNVTIRAYEGENANQVRLSLDIMPIEKDLLAQRELGVQLLKVARVQLEGLAASRGWRDWLVVREEVTELPAPK